MTVEQLLGILAAGAKQGASDIHLQVGYPPTFRLRGDLFASKREPLVAAETEALAISILGKESAVAKGVKHDVDCGFTIRNVARFRASIFRQRGVIGMVLRVIPLK